MLDDIFSNLIILIPLAVFIMRLVSAARKTGKKNSPPRIPVHFEDNKAAQPEKAPAKSVRVSPRGVTKARAARKDLPLSAAVSRIEFHAKPATEPVIATQNSTPIKTAQTAPRRGFNLEHLSPLKQAVVMSEILGTPKGLL